MTKKVMPMDDAAKLIKSDDFIVFNGFGSLLFPEEICLAIEDRFLKTGEPRNLSYMSTAGQGVWDETRMIEHISHEGMVKKIITAHLTPMLRLKQLVKDEKIEGYNLPMGVICHLYRATAGKKPGLLSKVGLKTFVDPRNGGPGLNNISNEELVRLMEIDGEEYLYYKCPKITVALLRGTTADKDGNITLEKEAFYQDITSTAMAAKASGGIVIVQVERLSGTRANSRDIKIPANLIDAIVVAPNQHQTMIEKYNPTYTGELVLPEEDVMPMLESIKELNIKGGRKRERNFVHEIIARRAAMELTSGALVNLGIGIPEMIPNAAKVVGAPTDITLTVESGIIGGTPSSGISFGAMINPHALFDMGYIFDMYDGGALDITFVGAMEVDKIGNVNVSRSGDNIIGVGGFINLTQAAKKLVFCFPFSGKGMNIEMKNGEMKILSEGKQSKFRNNVEQISASGEFSVSNNQKVLYITERCVFSLTAKGLELIEVAKGISIEKDIIEQMPFVPLISENLKLMDEIIFVD